MWSEQRWHPPADGRSEVPYLLLQSFHVVHFDDHTDRLAGR